jgi:tetrahydromethanopterin S-methyltransferase subunit H
MEVSDGFDTYYEVREVFYNSNNEPWGHGKVSVTAESLEALDKYIDWVKEALSKPLLKDADLVNRNANDPEIH